MLIVSKVEFEAYKLVVEEMLMRSDANFLSIIEILGEKGLLDEHDLNRLKTIIRPRILAGIDQIIQEKKSEKNERTDESNE
jgi:hypothetical protein